MSECDRESSTMKRPWHTGSCCAMVKKKGDLHKPGFAKCKYGNKIAPSPTVSEREAFNLLEPEFYI